MFVAVNIVAPHGSVYLYINEEFEVTYKLALPLPLYSPNCSQYISHGADKETSFKNQEFH